MRAFVGRPRCARTGRELSKCTWWLAAAAFALVLSLEARAQAACGDGIVDGSETCDDGATTSGDGCSAFCQREAGFVCTGAPSLCCFADAAAAYALSGNASFNTTTGEVILTPNAFNNRGYAWFKRRISFATDFSVAVKLYLGTNDMNGADGGSIMFQRNAAGTAAVGSLGDMLGANFSPLIAVEFDTWDNTSTFGDIPQDHVSIFQTAPNPASNQLSPAVCMDNACSNFEDGKYHSYRVDWTAATKTMVVTIDGNVRRTLTYDVVANVFAGDPNNIVFGFGAVTGSAANLQKFCPAAPAGYTVPRDSDADGVDDAVDADDDNDGILDTQETENLFGATDPSGDTDQDGIPNYDDPTFWASIGQAAQCPDTVAPIGDCDTVPTVIDADADGTPNHLDLDSDNDNTKDVIEAGGTDVNNDGRRDGCAPVQSNGACQGSPLVPGDVDGDSIPDTRDTDSDNDGDLDGSDCAPRNAAIYHAATEGAGDGVDANCDGMELCFDDDDGDGFLDTSNDTRVSSDLDCLDANEGSTSTLTTDCNDSAAAIKPGATEIVGNGVDDDCNGQELCFDDDDGDGFLDTSNDTRISSDADCTDPNEGSTGTPTTDCNDAAAAINPSAIEICDASNVDEDCDTLSDDADASATGKSMFFNDADGDSFGAAASAVMRCDPLAGQVTNGLDCNDAAAGIKPSATEICDGANVDEDCDGTSDDADPSVSAAGKTTFYRDQDADGFGAAAMSVVACDVPAGYVVGSTDCDDTSNTRYPGATELCDAIDQDCDGDRVESFANFDGDMLPNCSDDDDDNDGDLDVTDCNDANAAIHAGAADNTCNGIDDDCDIRVDEDGPTQDPACRGLDADGDGIPNNVECADPADCQDTDGDGTPDFEDLDSDGDALNDADECTTSPCEDTDQDGLSDALERSDRDSDADGLNDDQDDDSDDDGVDDGTECPSGVCDDTDGDGIPDVLDADDGGPGPGDSDGDGIADNVECSALPCVDTDGDRIPDYADVDADGDGDPDRSDCARTNAGLGGSAAEIVADGIDQDCDGGDTCYDDADDDGFLTSTPATRTSSDLDCSDPNEGSASDPRTDCNDAASGVNPAAIEVCDAANVDEDCDLKADDADEVVADAGKTRFYRDQDGDGFGALAQVLTTCDAPSGYVVDATDCDDAAALVNPAAIELCDPADVDENCDGARDNASAVGQSTFHRDQDGDGFGALAQAIQACNLPSGYVTDATDCDDASALVNPAASELCDGANVDEDCDGLADDLDTGALGTMTFYRDQDGDGFGFIAAPLAACDLPPGYVLDSTDCDDGAATVNSSAAEQCDASNVDEDCDGAADDVDAMADGRTTYYRDADGDGFGSAMVTKQACDPSAGYVTVATDCDDQSASSFPGATELCDAIDQDCDGSLLGAFPNLDGDALPDCSDDDRDGDGDPDATDCDDANPAVRAGAPDDTCNRVDDDCDGARDQNGPPEQAACVELDADGDGIPNGTECADPSACGDSDGDGTPDFQDEDADGDGARDSDECSTLPCADADDDGLSDYLERRDRDSDDDGVPDQEDTDSDGDGIDDAVECDEGRCGDEDGDGIPDQLDRAGDATGPGDSDDDGLPDDLECPAQPCADSDGDGTPDYVEVDADGDGALDRDDPAPTDACVPSDTVSECRGGDADGDGVTNGDECPDVASCPDRDADGTPDFEDDDADGDGTLDRDESAAARLDPCAPAANVRACASGDADGDGIDNAAECPDPTSCPDGDGDGKPDFQDDDADDDGVPDRDDEARSDACLPSGQAPLCGGGDADGDGVSNAVECPSGRNCADADRDGTPDYLDRDADGDAIDDGQDAASTDPCRPYLNALACPRGDADGDGVLNRDDAQAEDGCLPNPRSPSCITSDNDADGLVNAFDVAPEDPCRPQPDALACGTGDADGDGLTNAVECPDTRACGDDDGDGAPNYEDDDSDGDGIDDAVECADPRACTDGDGDGVPDWREAAAPTLDADGDGVVDTTECGADGCTDTDGDGTADRDDDDDDGDGITTRDEIALGTRLGIPIDLDGDGLPNYRDDDSDGDGLLDREEAGDLDDDGVPDYLQSTRVNASGGACRAAPGASDANGLAWLLLWLTPLVRRRRSPTAKRA